MIFRPELVDQIKAGTKTMTRRPVKDDEKDCRYQPGRVYALQPGRGREGVGYITVREVRQERLGDISPKDVQREGFKTVALFYEYWRTLHGRVDADQQVWVIWFQRGDALDRPRLLAARPGGPGGDYTHIPARAVREEGEAVPEEVQQKFSQTGRAIDELRLGDKRQRILDAIDDLLPHATGLDRKRLKEARQRAVGAGEDRAAA